MEQQVATVLERIADCYYALDDACRRLRHELAPTTRLIALTGYGQPQDRERAMAAGFDDHLVKPVDPQRLLEVLRETAR